MYRSLEDLPITLTVEDLMGVLGISKNTAYELVRSERLKTVRVGRQIRITKTALLEFLGNGETQSQA